jgi:hypothetical protein
MSLDRLVDTKRYVHRGLYETDALYHAEVAQMEAYARLDERVGGIHQPYSPTFDRQVRGINPFPDGRVT